MFVHTNYAIHVYSSGEQMDPMQALNHTLCNDYTQAPDHTPRNDPRHQPQETNNEASLDDPMSFLTNWQKDNQLKDCAYRFYDSDEETLDVYSTKKSRMRRVYEFEQQHAYSLDNLIQETQAKDDDNSIEMLSDDDCKPFRNSEQPQLQTNATPLEDSQKADNLTFSSSLQDLIAANGNDSLSYDDSQSTHT